MKKTVMTAAILVLTVSVLVYFFISPKKPPEPKKVLILGDSISVGVRASDEKKTYGAILAKEQGLKITNKAVSGYTTDNLLDLISKNEIQSLVKSTDYIIISIGGNDVISLGNLLMKFYNSGEFSKILNKITEIKEKTEKNIDLIISTLNKINLKTSIIIQNLYTTNIYNLQSFLEKYIDVFNHIYEKAGEKYDNVEICNVRELFKNSKKECIAKDNIHPNDYGNEIIAKYLLANFLNVDDEK